MSEHYVEAQLHTDENWDKPESSLVAFGQVTVDHMIKFNVQVRKFKDEEGNDKMFISYPRKKTSDKEHPYEDVAYPYDSDLREEIQKVVLEKVKYELLKDVNSPEITDVRVTALKRNDNLRGLATVTVQGMTIKGIAIIDGKNGMFVKMPQHQDSKGEYHDSIYGISKYIQESIQREVLTEYEKKLDVPEHEISRQKKRVPDS